MFYLIYCSESHFYEKSDTWNHTSIQLLTPKHLYKGLYPSKLELRFKLDSSLSRGYVCISHREQSEPRNVHTQNTLQSTCSIQPNNHRSPNRNGSHHHHYYPQDYRRSNIHSPNLWHDAPNNPCDCNCHRHRHPLLNSRDDYSRT